MPELNVLSLVEHKVETKVFVQRWLFFSRMISEFRTELDLVVDGIPLREHVRRWSALDKAPEEASWLTEFNPNTTIEQINRLLGLIPQR